MEITLEQGKTKFSEVLDQLTDENQQEVLGAVEALYFAQNAQNKFTLEAPKIILTIILFLLVLGTGFAQSSETDRIFARGRQYLDNNDYDRAIADFTEVIRLLPTAFGAYYNRGLAYLRKNNFDNAIEDYNQAIRLNGNFSDAYNNRGVAYLSKYDYSRAISDFETALRINPNNENYKKSLDLARGLQIIPTIIIVNNTGYTISKILITPVKLNYREGIVTLITTLKHGESISCRLSKSLGQFNTYTIELIDDAGDSYTKFDQTVTNNGRFVFTIWDWDWDWDW